MDQTAKFTFAVDAGNTIGYVESDEIALELDFIIYARDPEKDWILRVESVENAHKLVKYLQRHGYLNAKLAQVEHTE